MKEMLTITHAGEIMGKNYLDPMRAIRFGVKPSEQQLLALAEVPFLEATLEECKNTHILVATLPLSILDIRIRVDRKLFSTRKNAWYNDDRFAKDSGKAGWHLICKDWVKNSDHKCWDEQQTLLKEDEEVPSARVIVYTIIGYYLVTGEQILKNVYALTSSLGNLKSHIGIGNYPDDGLRIAHFKDDDATNRFVLASAKKPIRLPVGRF